MRNALAILATLVIPTLGNLNLHQRDRPAVVSLDIKRNDVAVSSSVAQDRARRKRDKTTSVALDTDGSLYYCNITLGTPGQPLRLAIDTSSADTSYGTYKANESSTYSFMSRGFLTIGYLQAGDAEGDYAADTLSIGGASLENFQFGINEDGLVYNTAGRLGLSYTYTEGQTSEPNGIIYPNLPLVMVNSGLIQSAAFSIWLNDLDTNEGSILFGGVDTDKYHGTLQTIPNLQINNDGVTLPIGVVLDTASSMTYLPNEMIFDIYNELGVAWNHTQEIGFLPCTMAEKHMNISFTFTSPTINVGIKEFVLDKGDYNSSKYGCIFGILPSNITAENILGDTFLRSAYVVYDIANGEVSLANTNFNSTTSNILEIGIGRNAVPGATAVSDTVTVWPTTTSTSRTHTANVATTTSNPAIARATSISQHMALGLAGAALLAL
ncbi:uncharacterized protein N7498_001024 [Penicillium cinerascens]|uniref:Peptidase A1 domain-containing protein n=1 Tax=Penicillium cinerascens TaxID=70096 RepID=A0A9W9NFD0_9EURO|nr:uncharacterized protein N7498_001024 [Penicillium cinerascens]KAJ5218925.1 hypothetical protein N7498_001024 [Penicillium cinerascens]